MGQHVRRYVPGKTWITVGSPYQLEARPRSPQKDLLILLILLILLFVYKLFKVDRNMSECHYAT